MLEESEWIGEMLEHVAADDDIRRKLGQVLARIEPLGGQVDVVVSAAGAVRIETDEFAARASRGHRSQQARIAMANLDDHRTLRNHSQNIVDGLGHEL